MKKIIAITTGLLMMATGAFAAGISQNSSWDEIRADKSLKVVFPVISVGNGKFVSYDKLYLDGGSLTTGRTWEDPVAWEAVGGSDDKDKEPVVALSVTRKAEAPLTYEHRVFKLTPRGGDDDHVVTVVSESVRKTHPTTVEARVYRKADRGSHESKDSGDLFLFKKAYSVPYIGSNG